MLNSMSLSSQSIRRRAKKYLVRNRLEIFVSVAPGFERIAQSELESFASNVQAEHGGLSFTGDIEAIYRANLGSRTASRVLLRLGEFLAQSYPMLYNRAQQLDWVAILGNCPDVTIRVAARASRLRNDDHIRKVIFDALKVRLGRHLIEPKLVANGPLEIQARIFRDRCTLSLNTSGQHLHRRGYRTNTSLAPIRETTAAALLLTGDLANYDVVVDPFCGTGTFPIEAQLIFDNYPPGAHREFAFAHSPLHTPGRFQHVRRQLLSSSRARRDKVVLGFDIDHEAIQAARQNALRAARTSVRFEVQDAFSLDLRKLSQPHDRKLVVANLPYGRRLGSSDDARQLAARFVEFLAASAPGWDALIVVPEGFAVGHPALTIRKRVRFTNGGIPVIAAYGQVRE